MSGVAKKLMGTTAAGGGFTAIEDVFSTYLYAGNGSTQTITNGIDLAGEGGLVWIKARGVTSNHSLNDSERSSFFNSLRSNLTSAQSTGFPTSLSATSVGFDVPNNDHNVTGRTYASWTFRKAPRFFDVVTYTGTGAARTVDHNLGTTVGSIIIKRTDTTSNWAVYHRGNTAAPETDFLSLNLTNATADDATYWNDTAPTDSVFTVGTNAAVNASGGTYVAYLYAHDPLGPSGDGSDGLISCGSYTGNASNSAGPVVNLGWEPQWVMIKAAESPYDWFICDTMRGWTAAHPKDDNILRANTSGAETANTEIGLLNSRGFQIMGGGAEINASGQTYIYIAIRRGPMRAPESGTDVYLSSTATGVVTTGFPVDLHIGATQAGLSTNHRFHDRLRGGTKELVSSSTAAETTVTDLLFDGNEGLRFSFGSGQVNHFFRRAPNFFDVVAYTGDGVAGRTVPHNLGVAPEMIIIKNRTSDGGWLTYAEPRGISKYLFLNQSSAETDVSVGYDFFFSTSPTATDFTVNSGFGVNGSGQNFIAYLFATLAGVSKVGSYTGNGTSQTINCGFTSSARFIIIRRTDSTGDWYVWDTARGIVAANDPHLSLNTTAAEVTSDDSIDPDSSGFIVNQVAATNINVSAASYIFYSVS